MSNNTLKTEQDKVKHIKELAKNVDSTTVRKEIGKIWGLKKTARNNKWRKIFGGGYQIGIDKAKKGEKDFSATSVVGGDGKVYKMEGIKNTKFSAPKVEVKGDKAVVDVKNSKVIYTLDELIEVCGINMDEWSVSRFTANSYGDNFQAKAEFVKKKDEKHVQKLLEQFIEEADNFSPSNFVYSRPKENGKLYILNLQDTHLGKLAANSETNWGSFDLNIAKKVYKEAVDDLLKNAPTEEIETVMLICGSDLLHFDTESVTTTSGTRLDSDSRWSKVYNEGCQMITEVVEKLASQFKVEVMVVCGNHSRLSEYALGSYVKAFFRHHENVKVNNEPLDRKYFGFGKNLIGFTHSENTKIQDLPLIMMRECQSEVSKYEQFTFLTGHRHTDKLTDHKGVRVLVCPALCPPDKFHSANGYIGNVQSAQGLLFSDWGLQQIIYSKPPEKVR